MAVNWEEELGIDWPADRQPFPLYEVRLGIQGDFLDFLNRDWMAWGDVEIEEGSLEAVKDFLRGFVPRVHPILGDDYPAIHCLYLEKWCWREAEWHWELWGGRKTGWWNLVRDTVRRELWGLENPKGVPQPVPCFDSDREFYRLGL